MKNLFICSILFIPSIIFSQIELPEINGEEDWQKVIITKKQNDLEGLIKVSTVKGEAKKVLAKEAKLRIKANEQIKRAAAKKGASVIFVTFDSFETFPSNNVQLEGVAYKKNDGKNEEIIEPESSLVELPEINGEEDWEKVVVTINPNEVVGLTKITTIKEEAKKVLGQESILRTQVIEQVKRAAAQKGASIVFITADSFTISAFNKLQIEGIAYNK